MNQEITITYTPEHGTCVIVNGYEYKNVQYIKFSAATKHSIPELSIELTPDSRPEYVRQ